MSSAQEIERLLARVASLESELAAALDVAQRYERYDVWQGLGAENLRLEARVASLESALADWANAYGDIWTAASVGALTSADRLRLANAESRLLKLAASVSVPEPAKEEAT